jgi:hypothetical protein
MNDASAAETYPELAAAWREEASRLDPAQITNPQCATMKIQFESCRATFLSCAESLERLNKKEAAHVS